MENRIQAMTLVHQMLYRSQDLSFVDLRQYLHDLTSLLVQSYRISPERITLDFDLAEESASIDMAIPCGLVFHEIMSNALKYAFPEGHAGTIRIQLARVAPEMLELVVSDDGVGVPPGLDFRAQETLGFQMILALTEHQLQGEAIFESNHGVTWRLRFPDTLYAARV
jgi:two-component sensor histidine kinase